MKYEYNLDIYTKPFYEGDTVYYETALFIGEESSIKTLFPIKEMVALLNYGLYEKYEEGKDYIYEGNTIKRLKGSRIPYFKKEEIYLKEPNDKVAVLKIIDKDLLKEAEGGKYFLYGEQGTFTSKQIAIVYKHEPNIWKGTKAIYQGDKLAKTIQKLNNHEPVTLVFTGDSITVGCDSSGTEHGGFLPPLADSYPVMVHKKLEKEFNTKIKYINTAVGGTHAEWGLENIDENVNQYNPDLVIVAFGMNNPYQDEEFFYNWANQMVEKLTKHNKDVEIIFVSTTLPNPQCSWWGKQYQFIKALKRISKPNVAVVDMTTMHQDLMDAGKKFVDMTANCVNHPNDFIARIYAQQILKTIIK